MFKFVTLTVATMFSYTVASILLFTIGVKTISLVDPRPIYSLFVTVLLFGSFVCAGLAIFGVFMIGIAPFTIQLYDNGIFTFKDNWLGNKFKALYSRKSGSVSFCYFYICVVRYAVSILLPPVIIWIWYGISNSFESYGIDAFFWKDFLEALPLFMGIVLIVSSVFFVFKGIRGVMKKILHGSKIKQMYKQNVCPDISTR